MAIRVLKGNGINSALINFAGNIYAYGTPPERFMGYRPAAPTQERGTPWFI
jgi:hypothetical protein